MFSNEFLSQLPEKVEAIWQSLPFVLPEFLLVLGILILTLSTFWKKPKSINVPAIFSFLILVGVSYAIIHQKMLPANQNFFLGLLKLDAIAIGFKLIFVFICAGSFGIILLNHKRKAPVEWYIFMIAALLALQILVMANNFLSLYLSLETLSISLYMLVILFFDKKGVEGSLKYLLFGALSSGLMLYGMSFLYGFSGSLDFSLLHQMQFNGAAQRTLFGFSLLLTFSGLFFKLSSVPFHIWAPDVYESSSNAFLAFLSTAPKIAALLVIYRLQILLADFSLDLSGIQLSFSDIILIIAVLSIALGNTGAIRQQNAKRILAYSGIAQIGFLLIALLAKQESILANLLFYGLTYSLANIAAFLLLEIMEIQNGREGEASLISLSGLGRVYPLLGISALLIMISLTGLPPLLGFTAKFVLFIALWDSYQALQSGSYLFLFGFGLINTVISLFYYLKIPYFMFFKHRSEALNQKRETFINYQSGLLFVLVSPLLLFFLRPDLFYGIINYLIK